MQLFLCQLKPKQWQFLYSWHHMSDCSWKWSLTGNLLYWIMHRKATLSQTHIWFRLDLTIDQLFLGRYVVTLFLNPILRSYIWQFVEGSGFRYRFFFYFFQAPITRLTSIASLYAEGKSHEAFFPEITNNLSNNLSGLIFFSCSIKHRFYTLSYFVLMVELRQNLD